VSNSVGESIVLKGDTYVLLRFVKQL